MQESHENRDNHFTGGVDRDSVEKYVDNKDYLDALNIRNGYNSKKQSASEVKGNKEINNFFLPAGDNTCIGSIEDKVGKSIIFFTYNTDTDVQSIFRWFPYKKSFGDPDGQIQPLYRGNLGFSKDWWIRGRVVDGRYLYWTDAHIENQVIEGNPPRMLDMEHARWYDKLIQYSFLFGPNSLGDQLYRFIVVDPLTGNTVHQASVIYDQSSPGDLETFATWLKLQPEMSEFTIEYCNNRELLINYNSPGSRIRLVTTDKIIWYEYNTYPENFISDWMCIIKRPPKVCPQSEYVAIDGKANNLMGGYQFCYRYIFIGGEKSAFSSFGKMALPYKEQSDPGETLDKFVVDTLLNAIEVNFTDDILSDPEVIPMIKSIEIAFRESNTTSLYRAKIIDRSEITPGENIFLFTNDRISSIIPSDGSILTDDAQYIKLFDNVPRLASTIETVSDESGNSSSVLAGCLEQYDNIDCVDVDISVTPVELLGDNPNTDIANYGLFLKNFGQYDLGIVYKDEWSRRSTVQKIKEIKMDYKYLEVGPDFIWYMPYRIPDIKITINHKAPDWARSYEIVRSKNKAADYFKQIIVSRRDINYTELDLEVYTFNVGWYIQVAVWEQTDETGVEVPTDGSGLGIPDDRDYYLKIPEDGDWNLFLFGTQDDNDSTFEVVVKRNGNTIVVPVTIENNNTDTKVNILFRIEDLQANDLVSLIADDIGNFSGSDIDVQATLSKGFNYESGEVICINIPWYYPNDPDRIKVFSQEDGIAYVPQEGDYLRIIATILITDPVFPRKVDFSEIELQIIGFKQTDDGGFNIYVYNHPDIEDLELSLTGSGYLLEVYRKPPQGEFFYETGNCFGIDNGNHLGDTQNQDDNQPCILSFLGGDITVRNDQIETKLYLFDTGEQTFIPRWPLEQYSIFSSKFLPTQDIGWPNVEDVNYKENFRYNRIRVSDVYIPDSKINGLSAFRELAYIDIDIDFGCIKGLIKTHNVLLAICEFKTQPLYIGKERLLDLSGKDFIGRTQKLLNIADETKLSVGTQNPESVIEEDGYVYAYDGFRGLHWRYASNGQEIISNNKMSRYFRDMGAARMEVDLKSNRVLGSYQREFMANMLTFFSVEDKIDSEFASSVTWLFDEESNRYKCRLSFVPEQYGKIGQIFCSFKNGKLFIHESDEVPAANFYNVQYPTRVKFVSNGHPDAVKQFWNIRISSTASFEAPEIIIPPNSDYKQGMLSRLKWNRFKSYEGIFHADFLRDMLDNDKRFRDIVFPEQREVTALLQGRLLRGEVLIVTLELDQRGQSFVLTRTDIEYSLSHNTKT